MKLHSASLGLVRGLGLWSATTVVVGSMIGQSIFLVGGDVARQMGSAFKCLALWFTGGIVILFGTFCYAELGAAMPEAGGDYIYLSRGLHPTCGFLYGWTSSLVLKPGSAAIIASGFSRLAAFLWPSFATPAVVRQLKIAFSSQSHRITLSKAQLCAAPLVLMATLINYFGIHAAGRFQILLTGSKVAAVVAIVVPGFTTASAGEIGTAQTAAPVREGLSAILTALVPIMMAYNGFGILGHVGGEIVRPDKNLPWAAIYGSVLVVGLYVFANWAYFRVLGFERVAQSEHVASDVLAAMIGSRGATLMTVAMLISAFGSLHANLLASPRVPYAMARDGSFFSFAKHVQPVFHTPSGALIFEACAATLLVLTGTYQDIYSLAMFAYWMFYAFTAMALIALRRHEPDLPRAYRAWGYPWTPLIFGTVALAISANLWWVRPVRSSIGLGIILLGLPFFYYWRKQAACIASDRLGESSLFTLAAPRTKLWSSPWRAGS
jgi:basic amino acid/polyamine antiporter, APA family